MSLRGSAADHPAEDEGARTGELRRVRLLYSVREAAEMLSIGRVKLYELMAAGKIESVKLGSRRIPRDALEEFVDQLRAQSGESL